MKAYLYYNTVYIYVIDKEISSVWILTLMCVYIQLCYRCEGARQSIYKVLVKYQQGATKNTEHGLEMWNCCYPKCLDSWGYQDIPRKGVPPEHSAWEERIAVDLNGTWDNLIFAWRIILCTGGEHWGKVVVTITGNRLVLDPTHQEKAMEVVNHCGHTFSLTVVV